MQEVFEIQEVPAALTALQTWSTRLVGLQTGVLGLVVFITGQQGFLQFKNALARWAVYIAIMFFAGSVIFATFVLSAIPSIRWRMSLEQNDDLYIAPNGEFWLEPLWKSVQIPFWVFTGLEHWLFVLGILLFAIALIIEKVKAE